MTEHKGRGRSPTQAERRHLPDGFDPRWGLYEVRHAPVHVPQSDTQIGGAETGATSSRLSSVRVDWESSNRSLRLSASIDER